MLVSVCMIAKNEERYIERALRSLEGLADEVILVDTGSTDGTPDIATSLGARVFFKKWRNDFAAARNASLKPARGEWIVILDADEFFEPSQSEALRRVLENAPADVAGFSLFQANLRTDQTPYEITDQSTTIRAFRNRPWHRYRYQIHEQVVDTLTDGRIEHTDLRFLHSGYQADVSQMKKKGDRNRILLEEQLQALASDDRHRYYIQMQLGAEYQRIGDWEKSIAAYDAAFRGLDEILMSPHNRGFATVLITGYCHALVRSGQPAKAVGIAEQAIEAGLRAHSVWFCRGWAEVESGRVAEGVRDLLWSVALSENTTGSGEEFLSDQDSLNAWHLAIQALLKSGSLPAAAALTIRALEARPQEVRFLGMATALAEAEGGVLRPFVTLRAPESCLRDLAAKALAEGRVETARAVAARLGASGQRPGAWPQAVLP